MSGASKRSVASVFNTLISQAPDGAFPGPIALVVDDKTALQGRSPEGRGHACAEVSERKGTIYIAEKLLHADIDRQRGVLAHELAHVHLLMLGQPNHSERDADDKARALFGCIIRYDAEDVQTTSHEGVTPRPARLPK